jgi:hypothetical protein
MAGKLQIELDIFIQFMLQNVNHQKSVSRDVL